MKKSLAHIKAPDFFTNDAPQQLPLRHTGPQLFFLTHEVLNRCKEGAHARTCGDLFPSFVALWSMLLQYSFTTFKLLMQKTNHTQNQHC